MNLKTKLKAIRDLDYNQHTGLLTWDVPDKERHGLRAGSLGARGYITFRLGESNVQAHRVCWYLAHGTTPNIIDHVNGIKDDNRLCNLRSVTHRENMQNSHKHRSGKLVGACYISKRKKWCSSIRVNRKTKHLGYFDTEQEAHEAYIKALSGV